VLDFSRLDKAAVVAHQANDRFGPISETLIRAFYKSVLVPGDAVVDVGVHYGFHLFGMRDCVGDGGLVYGIEANIERYAALLKRLSNRGITNVHLLNIAAANEEGFRDFFINRTRTGRSGLAENKKVSSDEIEKIVVYAAPLSSILPKKRRLKFVKIDIEGGEFPALLGAKSVIEDSQMLIVFEGKLSLSAAKFGFPTEMVGEYMRELHYCVFDLFGNPVDSTTGTGGFGWNFVAGPDNDAARASVGRALTDAWSKVLAEAAH
jgi:FkbM family methyltransferase